MTQPPESSLQSSHPLNASHPLPADRIAHSLKQFSIRKNNRPFDKILNESTARKPTLARTRKGRLSRSSKLVVVFFRHGVSYLIGGASNVLKNLHRARIGRPDISVDHSSPILGRLANIQFLRVERSVAVPITTSPVIPTIDRCSAKRRFPNDRSG